MQMRVTYFPQRNDMQVTYDFAGDTVTVIVNDQTESFDFGSLGDGETAEITSSFDPCPVLAARRVDGELHVTLLRPIPARPSDPHELEAWKRLWTEGLEVTINGDNSPGAPN